MSIQIADLTVGQEVGVVRSGSWDAITQGIYTVTKINKVRAVLARKSDGYVRNFSVKTDNELGNYSSRCVWVESIKDYTARGEKQSAERARNATWSNLKNAAQKQDLAAIKLFIQELEKNA